MSIDLGFLEVLQAAWDYETREKTERLERRSLAAARRKLVAVERHLGRLGPELRKRAGSLRAEVDAKLAAPAPTGDRHTLTRVICRELDKGVPSHEVAHALINTGICAGPHSARAVQRCLTNVRKRKERYLRSCDVRPRPVTRK